MLAICLSMLEGEEDRQRFTRLYTAHEKKVYLVALRILGDPGKAEDAAQQTWLQLLRNWARVSWTSSAPSGGPPPSPRTGTRPPGRSTRRNTPTWSP